MTEPVNSLANNKNLDQSKLKAIADNIKNVTPKLKFVLGRVENTVGKEENAGEKKKMLVTSIFYFSHNDLYSVRNTNHHLNYS